MTRGACLFALMVLLAGSLARPAFAAAGPATSASSDERKAVVIQISGEIDDYNRDTLFQRFDQARQLGAKVVILDIDTDGGMETSGLDISHYIRSQDNLHVIAYVQRKAISAGAMIAMACDEIVVSEDAVIGDCAPIKISPAGLEALPPAERAKFEAPVLQDFKISADRNHHDPLLSAGMVNVRQIIYWIQNTKTGEKKFVDEIDHTMLTADRTWVDVPGSPSPIKDDKTLLLLNSKQAMDFGIATTKANSISALATERGYNIVADLSPGAGEHLVEFLSGAIVRGFLLTVFFMALYMIFHAPGHGVGEIIGVVALGLMLGIPMLTGYAQWWEIILIFVGLALIAFEILLPGHIFPGVTGGILVLIGFIMTFVPKTPTGTPSLFSNLNYMLLMLKNGLFVVAGGLAASLFLWFWLNRFMPKLPYVNRLILTATSGGPSTHSATTTATPLTGAWPPVGGIGRAVSELKPGGSAEFYDANIAGRRSTSVVSESGFLPAGSEIVVREVSGSRVVVQKKDSQA